LAFWNIPTQEHTLYQEGSTFAGYAGKKLLCSSKKGICDRTGLPHIRLTGFVRGAAKTRAAEEYPRKIANLIAAVLSDR